MISKSLIQFSVDGWSCVIHLGPNYDGGNENNGDLLQKVPCMQCYAQCPQSCRRPLLTHASVRDSWTLTCKSESVSRGVRDLSPGSWCTQVSVCTLQGAVSQSCVSSGSSTVGLIATSKRVYAIPRSATCQAAPPAAVYC